MAEMTHEYSHFPNQLYSLNNFLDLADAPENVVQLVTTIKQYMLAGQYTEAANLLSAYKAILSQYFIDASYINALDEELRNVEIYVKSQRQGIYFSDSEPDCVVGDVWIG